MKFITKSEKSIRTLASIALNNHLYHTTWWTMYRCYQEILDYKEIADESEIILLQDDDEKYIGAIYFNNDTLHYGTNVQVFVLPEYRNKGYGKSLFVRLNKRLKNKQRFSKKKSAMKELVKFYAGRGVPGSLDFWEKMGSIKTNIVNLTTTEDD